MAELRRIITSPRLRDDGDPKLRTLEPSSRQLEIITAMARGKAGKEIASSIGLSVPRTNELIGEVHRLLGARNWAQVVLRAVELGWIEPWVPPDAGPDAAPQYRKPLVEEQHLQPRTGDHSRHPPDPNALIQRAEELTRMDLMISAARHSPRQVEPEQRRSTLLGPGFVKGRIHR